jgi:hypothetical protein
MPRPHLVLESIPQPPDLLSRFREAFALPMKADPTVDRELAWYAQQP